MIPAVESPDASLVSIVDPNNAVWTFTTAAIGGNISRRVSNFQREGFMSLARFALVVALSTSLAMPVVAAESSPPGAKAYIIWPRDGARIKGGKFWLRMGLSGMGLAPAGVTNPGTGHHHVIVDADLPPLNEPIPNDENHLHFGKGQSEVRMELPKGTHTLQLLLGDANHVPFDPPVYSNKITITVP